MTREEAKELLPIIQAFAEGKKIQFRCKTGEWLNILSEFDFTLSPDDYRIKPEPKYRPFKTQGECWNEMLKHQPLGWLRSKRIKDIYQLITIRNHEIRIFADLPLRFSRAYREYEFLDGTPFGIKEE